MTAPAVTFRDGRAVVVFDRFDLDSYKLFIKSKKLPESEIIFDEARETYTLTTPARFAPILGVPAPARFIPSGLQVAPHLFDYQRHTLHDALEARRFAVWWDCGLGKTILFNEWARHIMGATGGKVLTLTLPDLITPTVEMVSLFHGDSLPVRVLRSRDELIRWCRTPGAEYGIAGFHKMAPGVIPEFRNLAGLCVDESSILKSGGGVIKWNLIKSAKGIEYKLSCTATPAPNDVMEYASQAGFLEKIRNEGEVLWTWFSRTKEGDYYLKPHAKEGFYAFLSTWSSYLRDPRRFGWKDGPHDLPQPIRHDHRILATHAQMAEARRAGVFARGSQDLLEGPRMGVVERGVAAQIARGFRYTSGEDFARIDSRKPAFVADLIRREVAAGRQTLAWTTYTAETRLIAERLRGMKGVAVLDGTVKAKDRLGILADFRAGNIDALLSRARMIGYGQNFPGCTAQVWSGLSDSYEDFYQGLRRSFRQGATSATHVHVPYVRELEGEMRDNCFGKEAAFLRDAEEQETHYMEALRRLREAA